MASKRYAVLNKDGVVVNHIVIADPMPDGYWPGYGAYLLCEEGASKDADKAGLEVLNVTPDKALQPGDAIDLQSGAVTKWTPTKNAFNENQAYPAKLLDERGDV